MSYLTRAGLSVAPVLADFVEDEALPGTGMSADTLWAGLADILARFAPVNRALLAKRDHLQAQIDAWHSARAGQAWDAVAYQAFLTEIGYRVPEPAPFTIDTENVDAEVATMAGPQLVVPSLNTRFALNAANARWGSLYDAFYGTDALGEACVVSFSYGQTRNLGFAFIGWGAAREIQRENRSVAARKAAFQAWRNGRAARWLPGLDYEALFAEPLEAARTRLGIRPATVYAAVPVEARQALKLRAA